MVYQNYNGPKNCFGQKWTFFKIIILVAESKIINYGASMIGIKTDQAKVFLLDYRQKLYLLWTKRPYFNE